MCNNEFDNDDDWIAKEGFNPFPPFYNPLSFIAIPGRKYRIEYTVTSSRTRSGDIIQMPSNFEGLVSNVSVTRIDEGEHERFEFFRYQKTRSHTIS